MGKMKYCESCETDRPKNHKYCIECGEELVILSDTCLKCHHQLTEEDEESAIASYCPMCGEGRETEEVGER